jgi:DNA-binding CsgD family transcriptional regulator
MLAETMGNKGTGTARVKSRGRAFIFPSKRPHLSPDFLIKKLLAAKPDSGPLRSLGLTARETEVLTWIAQGKTNYEIGVILNAGTRTICKHVEHILVKLNVENRTGAAAIALATLARVKG